MSANDPKRTLLGLAVLCTWQARLHEIQGITVKNCRVSEGISQPPLVDSDPGIELHHFSNFRVGIGQAAKTHVGDRQEQMSVVKIGLRERMRGFCRSPQH